MKDEESHSKAGKKPWFERLSQWLIREPQDREELVDVLHDAEHRHLLASDALSMIEGVLEVSDMQARDIMVPRSQMVSLEMDAVPLDVVKQVAESGHSRFPVFGKNRDEIIGILHGKDLLQYFGDVERHALDLKKILRKPMFVPESKRLDMLLKEFRLRHTHIAIVIDEFGGVAGLITMEDILECIVGDIADEFDDDEAKDIVGNDEEGYIVNALTTIDDFNDYFETTLNDEEFTTIGGFVTQGFGHLPKQGECVDLAGFSFEVLNGNHRRINQLKVFRRHGENEG